MAYRLNPLDDPRFGNSTREYGDGGALQLGNANGYGTFDFSPFGQNFNFGDPNSVSGSPYGADANAIAQWLQQNGYDLMGEHDDSARWLQDAQGQQIGERQTFASDDDFAGRVAMLALLATGVGAAAGGAGAAGGAAVGAGGAAAGGATAAELAAINAAMGGGLGGTTAAGGIFAGGAGATGAGLGGAALSAGEFGAGMSGLGSTGLGAGGSVTGGGVLTGSTGALGSSAGGLGSLLSGVSGNQWLSLGGNLLSGALQSNAAGKASDAQLAAGREANDLQKYMYDQTRSDFAPYREAGTTALAGIQNLLKNPGSITSDPGYQFSLNEGMKARENSASARGMQYSGSQQKALTRYGTDYSSTKLNDSFNRLASVAGIGQQATGSTSSAGQNYGNQAGNTLQQMGNVRGSGYIGQNNAWADAARGIGNTFQDDYYLKMLRGGG